MFFYHRRDSLKGLNGMLRIGPLKRKCKVPAHYFLKLLVDALLVADYRSRKIANDWRGCQTEVPLIVKVVNEIL